MRSVQPLPGRVKNWSFPCRAFTPDGAGDVEGFSMCLSCASNAFQVVLFMAQLPVSRTHLGEARQGLVGRSLQSPCRHGCPFYADKTSNTLCAVAKVTVGRCQATESGRMKLQSSRF